MCPWGTVRWEGSRPVLGKDKSFIAYLGVLKAPASIRLEQEAQPPFLLRGICSRKFPLVGEAGTSPARGDLPCPRHSLGGPFDSFFRADQMCCGCFPSLTVLAVRDGRDLSPGILSGLTGSRFYYFFNFYLYLLNRNSYC